MSGNNALIISNSGHMAWGLNGRGTGVEGQFHEGFSQYRSEWYNREAQDCDDLAACFQDRWSRHVIHSVLLS